MMCWNSPYMTTRISVAFNVIFFLCFALQDSDNKLSFSDKQAIRLAVYDHEIATSFPQKGKWAFLNIVVLPNSVEKCYRKNKSQTIELLEKIVVGARPDDAVVASAFIMCLIGSPPEAYVILHFEKSGFDKVDPKMKITPRENLRRILEMRKK